MLQLTREQPPGYGGVERVAHEVADAIAVHRLTPTSQVYFFLAAVTQTPYPSTMDASKCAPGHWVACPCPVKR